MISFMKKNEESILTFYISLTQTSKSKCRLQHFNISNFDDMQYYMNKVL